MRRRGGQLPLTTRATTKSITTHEPFRFESLAKDFPAIHSDSEASLAHATKWEKIYLSEDEQLTIMDHIRFCRVLLRMSFAAHSKPELQKLDYRFHLCFTEEEQKRRMEEYEQQLAVEDVHIDVGEDGSGDGDSDDSGNSHGEGQRRLMDDDDDNGHSHEAIEGVCQVIRSTAERKTTMVPPRPSRIKAQFSRLHLKVLQQCIELALQVLDEWAANVRSPNTFEYFRHYTRATCGILAAAVASKRLWQTWPDFYNETCVADYRWNTDYCELLLDLLRGRTIVFLLRAFVIPDYALYRESRRMTAANRKTEDHLVRLYVSQNVATAVKFLHWYGKRCRQYAGTSISAPHTSTDDIKAHTSPILPLAPPCFTVLGDHERGKSNPDIDAAILNYETAFLFEQEHRQLFELQNHDPDVRKARDVRRIELEELMGMEIMDMKETASKENLCKLERRMTTTAIENMEAAIDRCAATVEHEDLVSHLCYVPSEADKLGIVAPGHVDSKTARFKLPTTATSRSVTNNASSTSSIVPSGTRVTSTATVGRGSSAAPSSSVTQSSSSSTTEVKRPTFSMTDVPLTTTVTHEPLRSTTRGSSLPAWSRPTVAATTSTITSTATAEPTSQKPSAVVEKPSAVVVHVL